MRALNVLRSLGPLKALKTLKTLTACISTAGIALALALSLGGSGLALATVQLTSNPPEAASSGAASAVVKTDQARAELVVQAPNGIAPGQSVWLGLKIEHAPHWHTYWRNPGDSGLPTTLQFELPAGFAVGEIAWPTPKALPVGPLVNYGYEGTLLLAVPLTVPAGWQGDALSIRLRADWLICKDVCIPEGGDFTLHVPARAASTREAALFASAAAAVPPAAAGVHATAQAGAAGLQLRVRGLPGHWQGKAVALFPELAGVIDNAAKPTPRWDAAVWTVVLPLSAQRSESPESMQVVLHTAGEAAGLRVPVAVSGPWPSPAEVAAARASQAPGDAAADAHAGSSGTALGFWGALALALLGGVLLNLMPCVFPVLSLKVLGFAQPGHSRQSLLAGGLAYSVGVIASFLALAGLLLALRAGGEQIGWGFQLQSPVFVAALAALFALIALNLMGVFEVSMLLPQGWATAQARHPLADHLLTGVLAVAVASPCTAPFMGASLGLAASLPAPQALSVFAALGLGMALPYLALSAWPGLAARLPRPGAWMLHFKTLMAFPMWATVIWLIWVLAHQAGADGAAAVLGLVLALAMLAWSLGVQGLSRPMRWVWRGVALLTLALTLVWAWPALQVSVTPGQASASPGEGQGDAWQPWSEARVSSALQQGQPVFVDFTAAWCVTCQFNKRTVLSQPAVQQLFDSKRVLLLRADWTQRDAAISEALRRMGRQGVPVYALHVPGRNAPTLLSEILSEREIRDALKSLP
jgi:thiol:disulfide interchange protein/DsbC/DsbD-like thiol-disulfide interchange protein